MTRRNSSNHYINNKKLYKVMIKFRKDANKAKREKVTPPKIPDYVGECFFMICNKLSTRPNFINYTYRDEMVADGIENCVAAAYGFNPRKSDNPFAYFTKIAWNAFIRRIQKEKKQQYIKHKNFENSNLISELAEEMFMPQQQKSDLSGDVIRDFEEKLTSKKLKSTVGDSHDKE